MTESLAFGTLIIAVLGSAIRIGTPVAFAAIGETISERSGVINLGLEGMMLVGAMAAVALQVETANVVLALIGAGFAGLSLAALHALIVVGLNGNQIVSGIGISILGGGLSGFLGRQYIGVQVEGIQASSIPLLADLPVVGEVLFQHDYLVYGVIVTAICAWVLLYRTRIGLYIRAVGEDPEASYAQAVPVRRVRVFAVLLGGFLAGLGGAYLSLAYAHLWAERMTAGQGWIAVGLVVVARWNPLWAVLTAFAFGALAALHPHLQASGVRVSSYLVAMLPYLFAVFALAWATFRYKKRNQGMPAALAQAFHTDRL